MTVDDEQLRDAVLASRSWRGVLRAVGHNEASSRSGTLLRVRCDALGIDYSHFSGQRRWADATLATEAATAGSWRELLSALGYPHDSGSARTIVRGHAARLGVSLSHLSVPDELVGVEPFAARPEGRHLRSAGALLMAAFLTLSGHRISWPLEPAAYDLLVDAGSSPLRVQVKTTTRREGNTWICSISHTVYAAGSPWGQRQIYATGVIDYFGIVDGDLVIYLIPAAVVGGRAKICLSKYRAFRLGNLGGDSLVLGASTARAGVRQFFDGTPSDPVGNDAASHDRVGGPA